MAEHTVQRLLALLAQELTTAAATPQPTLRLHRNTVEGWLMLVRLVQVLLVPPQA